MRKRGKGGVLGQGEGPNYDKRSKNSENQNNGSKY